MSSKSEMPNCPLCNVPYKESVPDRTHEMMQFFLTNLFGAYLHDLNHLMLLWGVSLSSLDHMRNLIQDMRPQKTTEDGLESFFAEQKYLYDSFRTTFGSMSKLLYYKHVGSLREVKELIESVCTLFSCNESIFLKGIRNPAARINLKSYMSTFIPALQAALLCASRAIKPSINISLNVEKENLKTKFLIKQTKMTPHAQEYLNWNKWAVISAEGTVTYSKEKDNFIFVWNFPITS